MGRHALHLQQARVAGLDAAGANAAPPSRPARAIWKAASAIRSARAPCISSGTLYRIHGSNEPETIGQAVSSGCIRMTNDDVVDLYSASASARVWW